MYQYLQDLSSGLRVETTELQKRHCTNMDDGHGVGKLKGNKSLGRLRRRWENNIKIYFQEVRSGGINWIYLARERGR
jgi:hypothetical protein